jgi:hypothetical protein
MKIRARGQLSNPVSRPNSQSFPIDFHGEGSHENKKMELDLTIHPDQLFLI